MCNINGANHLLQCRNIFDSRGRTKREKKEKSHEKSIEKTKKSFSYFPNLILLPLLSVVSRIMDIMIIVKRLHWLQSAREAILKVNKEKWDISLLELWFSLLSPLLKIFPWFFVVCRSTDKLPLSEKHSQNQGIPAPKCFSAPVLYIKETIRPGSPSSWRVLSLALR